MSFSQSLNAKNQGGYEAFKLSGTGARRNRTGKNGFAAGTRERLPAAMLSNRSQLEKIYGNRKTSPVTAPACHKAPRGLMGTGGSSRGAQLPGR